MDNILLSSLAVFSKGTTYQARGKAYRWGIRSMGALFCMRRDKFPDGDEFIKTFSDQWAKSKKYSKSEDLFVKVGRSQPPD